jgi:hypothetical protein
VPHVFPIIVTSLDSTDNKHGVQGVIYCSSFVILPYRQNALYDKKSLKIEKLVIRIRKGRTDNTMAKRKSTKAQTTIYRKLKIE